MEVFITKDELIQLLKDHFNFTEVEFVLSDEMVKTGWIDGVQYFDKHKVFNGVKLFIENKK